MSTPLNEVCDMIDTYGGRDKVMKALCYASKLVSGLCIESNPELSRGLGVCSSKFSAARATLRLIDDIPMLQYTLEYGFGRNEPDRVMSMMGLLSNIIDHVYYPIEKICWLSDNDVIKLKNKDKWDVISSVFWVASIYLNLMRTMRSVAIVEQHKNCIDRIENQSSETLNRLLAKQQMEMISVVRLTLDLIHAGSTLPNGYLWGGKLKSWHVGLIGTMSAFLGIYQYFAKKSGKK